MDGASGFVSEILINFLSQTHLRVQRLQKSIQLLSEFEGIVLAQPVVGVCKAV
jgi:hypothetical protein